MAIKLSLDVQYAISPQAPLKKLLPKTLLKQWVVAAIDADAQITLRFVDAIEGQTLNHEYRQKDYATNVLTFNLRDDDFPLEGLPSIMSDIVVCVPVIEKEAQEQQKPLLAHYAHMIIHGVLHAQGFDHLTDEEAQEMEALEIKMLQQLGFANPYQTDV